MSVKVVSVSTVAPAVATAQPCVLWLSNFQSYSNFDCYIKQVFYFSSPREVEFHGLVRGLRESLSRVLVHYYPLAGRMRRRDKEPSFQELHCNDDGVMFVEAIAPAVLGDPKQCAVERQLYPEQRVVDSGNSPLLIIQVTRFECGSVAMGVLTCENILDASSSFPFLKTWSELHRGVPLTRTPTFDASVLKARDPPRVTLPVRDYVVAPAPSSEAMVKSLHEDATSMKYQQRLFHISPDKVAALVAEVASGGGGAKPSAFEAISAMVWKCAADVKDLDDSEDMTYIYALSTKGRKRWSPEVPESYCGNSAHTPCLSARVGDIRSNHVSFAARLLHDDIAAASQERIQSAIDWMEIQFRAGRFVDWNFPQPRNSGRAMNSISLNTFPIYEVDFGFGTPRHFAFVLEAWYGNGAAIVLPTPEGGRSRHLTIMLPEHQMEKLLKHQFLRTYTTIEKNKE